MKKQSPLREEFLKPLSKPMYTGSTPIRYGTVESTGRGRKFVPKEREVSKVTYTKEGVRTVHRRPNATYRRVEYLGKKYYVNVKIAGAVASDTKG